MWRAVVQAADKTLCPGRTHTSVTGLQSQLPGAVYEVGLGRATKAWSRLLAATKLVDHVREPRIPLVSTLPGAREQGLQAQLPGAQPEGGIKSAKEQSRADPLMSLVSPGAQSSILSS
jgi:hypothetical protein